MRLPTGPPKVKLGPNLDYPGNLKDFFGGGGGGKKVLRSDSSLVAPTCRISQKYGFFNLSTALNNV